MSRPSSGRRSTTSSWLAGPRHPGHAACTSTSASSGTGRSLVRRAALALAREVERRAPGLATSKWWKEERQGVFLDYNQNAKDRTVAAAYSCGQRPTARVSAAVVGGGRELRPAGLYARDDAVAFEVVGDRHADIDKHPCSLAALLELSASHEREGLGDAPWPPQYKKQPGEPLRVQPSRAAKAPRPKPAAGRRTPKHPLIEIGRAQRKRTRSPAWSVGRRAIRSGLAPRTSRRAGRCDARQVPYVDAHPRQPSARP